MTREEVIELVKKHHTATFEFDSQMREYVCSNCGHYTAGEFDMEDEAIIVDGKIAGWALVTPRYCKHCGAFVREDFTNEDGKDLLKIIEKHI